MMSDKNACPFCQRSNKCMAESGHSCWCNNIDIPNKLLKLVPDEFKNKTCICSDCINTYIENPAAFKY